MRLVRIASLLLLAAIAGASASSAQIAVSITIAPPVLPIYVQPAIPAPGYIWTPGYWAYGDDGYFWVPGTWVRPPTVGVLWTPGYWGWSSGVYVWNAGYWGPRIGYYGGINYGYGYVEVGYAGGYWNGGVFSYNRTVNNFGGVTINNTYNKTVINNNVTQVSYNGGTGGTTAQPTAHELAAAKDTHTPPTALQTQHQTAASTNKALLASVNHGSPAVAATSKAGQFTGARRRGREGRHRQRSGRPQRRRRSGQRHNRNRQHPLRQAGDRDPERSPVHAVQSRWSPQGNQCRGPQDREHRGGQDGQSPCQAAASSGEELRPLMEDARAVSQSPDHVRASSCSMTLRNGGKENCTASQMRRAATS